MTNYKPSKNQSVISRQSEVANNDDHWLKQFENSLCKQSVQPRENTFEQITSIMNNSQSKYPTVQAKVEEMLDRSGMNKYMKDTVKISEINHEPQATKTAQQNDQNAAKKKDDHLPSIIKHKEEILRTLENIIRDTKGNLPLSAIISKLHSLHAKDVSEESDWDDEKLIRLVSRLNLEAKKITPATMKTTSN